MDESTNIFRLRDGRVLAWIEYGDPNGTPVFFFHGTPSCRLMHPDEDETRSMGVRLLVADRPGFGRSDPKPNKTLLDWADDVSELLDSINVDRLAIVGPSGGGPYVAACAYKLVSRITRATILGGSGPVDAPGAMTGIAFERRAGYFLARRAPTLLRFIVSHFRNPQKDPEGFFEKYTMHNPPADQALLARPEIRKMFVASYIEATRQGIEAFAGEVRLVARPWGFQLDEINSPVTLWYGDQDNITPIGMAHAMQKAIPDCHLRILSGEGHLFFLSRWREILEDLLS